MDNGRHHHNRPANRQRDDHNDRPAPARRRPHWLRWLIIAALLLALLFLLLHWLLQPQQLTPILSKQLGKALNLEIAVTGGSELRLRDQPQLVLHDISAREPGAGKPVLQAKRLLVSLPWATLRARGKDLTVTRLELDGPILDVPALQAWQAKRPPGDTRIPTLTDGLRIVDGRIDNDDWHIEDIAVSLPALHPQRPVNATIRGRYLDAPLAIPFNLAVALTQPANDAGVAVVGPLTIERGDWRLPAYVSLSGPLHLGQDELDVTPARIGLSARYESGETRLPFTLGLHGPLRFDEATWVLAPVGVALRGEDPLPTFDARGALALGRRLVVQLDGALPTWPAAWPALPAPIGTSRSPLPFALGYTGKPDLSEVVGLRLRRDATDFDSRFRLDDVLRWIDADSNGSPLPPIDGRLSTPVLALSGTTLYGVEAEFDDPALNQAAPNQASANQASSNQASSNQASSNQAAPEKARRER